MAKNDKKRNFLVSNMIYDYIVNSISLENIDAKYGLSRGSASSMLEYYRITGKDDNYQGSFRRGSYNGKYKRDPYVVKSEVEDMDDVVIDITLDVVKDFVENLIEGETLEDYLERKYEVKKSFFKSLVNAFKQGYQDGSDLVLNPDKKSNLVRDRETSGRDYLSDSNVFDSDEKILKGGIFKSKLFWILTPIVGFVLLYNFNIPFHNFIVGHYNDFIVKESNRRTEEYVANYNKTYESDEEEPGNFEYNGFKFIGRSIDNVPYKECVGVTETDIIVGNFDNGLLNGKGFYKSPDYIDFGYFSDGQLYNGVHYEEIDGIPYLTRYRSGEAIPYKVVPHLNENNKYDSLLAYDSEGNEVAKYYDFKWHDLDNNILESGDMYLDLNYFYLKENKNNVYLNSDNIRYRFGTFVEYTEDIEYTTQFGKIDLSYNTFIDNGFEKESSATFSGYIGDIKGEFFIGKTKYTVYLRDKLELPEVYQ